MAILQQRLEPRSLNSKHYLLPTPQAAPASGISTQIFLLRVNPFHSKPGVQETPLCLFTFPGLVLHC